MTSQNKIFPVTNKMIENLDIFELEIDHDIFLHLCLFVMNNHSHFMIMTESSNMKMTKVMIYGG